MPVWDRANEDLPTVDLEGVEIMAAVGPVKGIGSPPEGDHWTPEDLRGMAQAASELAEEIRPPAAIGHFPKFSDPAVGHLENIRTSEDGTKLLADIKEVPRKFADLVKAKAYRSRSVEMKANMTGQKNGKTYPWAITGLAFGGGKLPAVRTLDDVVALYEADEESGEVFVQLEENEVAPDAERLLEAVYEQAQTIAELSAQNFRLLADTRAMADEKKYSDEQRRQFAEATGLEADKVSDEMLAKAGVPLEQPTPPPEPPKPPEGDEKTVALEQRLEATEKRVKDAEARAFEAERKAVIETALKEGRFTPGEREGWERRYETSPQAVVAEIAKLPKNEELSREYGEDGSDVDLNEEERKAYEDQVTAVIAEMTGVPVEAVL